MKFKKPLVLYGRPSFAGVTGELPRLVGEDDVACHHEVECASPHRAVHHRDRRRGEALYGSKQYLERLVVGDRIHVRKRQFVDVVAGRPDRLAACGANHDRAHPRARELVQAAEHLADQVGAEGVALGVVIERERADPILQLGLDERHGLRLNLR